jgi:cell wall-associated NlpC family hydrolase
MKLFQVISFLVAIWATLKEHLNIEEISKEGLKDALGRFKDLFGYTRITPERADKFFETAEIVKEMGGIDALHEGLTELKKAGLLNQFTSLYDEKQGQSAGGLARSRSIVSLNDFSTIPIETPIRLSKSNGQKVVEVAELEIGVKESPAGSNLNKYGEWFGFNGVPWCAIFVSWVYHFAGFPFRKMGYTKGFASVILALDYFRKNNQVTSEPKPGDLVFFDWQKDGKFDHIGIFVKWIDQGRDVFETIEGNTSAGNDSNGGQVQCRERSQRATYNVVFVHPAILDV